jgi:hypothetical protein
MNAKEFYKQKTNHDLKENYGVRLTGEELFDLMEEFAAQHREPVTKASCNNCYNRKTNKNNPMANNYQPCANCHDLSEWELDTTQHKETLPTDEEIEIEMDNRSFVTSWDRTIGRTMARWVRSNLRTRNNNKNEK